MDLASSPRTNSRQPATAAATIALIALYRLAPHPWNLTPVGALFVLSGLYLGRARRAWLLPFAALLVSDALIYFSWNGTLFQVARLWDYVAFGLILLVGAAARGRSGGWRVASVLSAPVVFYLVSNFAVWAAPQPLYPHTVQGLAACYLAAIPFFGGTLAGDWLFGLAGMAAVEGLPRLRLWRIGAA